MASISQDDDQVNVEILHSRDCGGGEGLRSAHRGWGEELDVVEGALVVDAALSLGTALAHDGDSLDGVGSVGRLSGKHNSVGAIKDSVGDVGGFGTGRPGGVDHGLEHLGGSDDGLGCNVGLLDHPLLGNEDLLGRDLHAEITTGDHDTIGGGEDFIVVVESLLVLDLGDDLDVGAAWSKKVTDVLNIVLLADERGCNHVDSLLKTEISQIGLILLGEGGKVNDSAWEVHVFLLAELGTILANNFDAVL